MHIETLGHGPALVLIHGWALHGGVFAPLVERLAANFQLHLVDLPGHGHSRDDDTALTLPFLAHDIAAATPPAAWLGWSLGGLVALHAAATLPQVRGLVMLAATPRFVRAADWPDAVEASIFARFGQELAQDYRGTLERFLALDTLGSDHGRAELRTLKEMLTARGEPAARTLQEGLHLLERSDLRRALPGLRVPSLWIAGQRDRLVSAQGMQAAAALATDARTVVIPGGGHAPFLGQADLVATTLRDFLDALH